VQLFFEDFGHEGCEYAHWHEPDSIFVYSTNLHEVPDPAPAGCGYGSIQEPGLIAWMTQSEVDAWEAFTGISLGVQ